GIGQQRGIARVELDGSFRLIKKSPLFQSSLPTMTDGGDGSLYGSITNNIYVSSVRLGGIFRVSTSATEAISDFDDDGRSDAMLFRPSTARWNVRTSSGAALAPIQFGASGDLPVAGDFDGDGRPDVAVFRPSTGGWLILTS